MSKDIIIVKPEDKSIVVSKKSGKNIVIGKQSGGGSFPTDYAKESTSQEILTATSDLAKQGSNAAATNSAILEAMSHISPTDPNSLALAQFFGVTLLEGYEFMQDTEVCDELEDIMRIIDPNLTAAQAAAITAQTLNPSES